MLASFSGYHLIHCHSLNALKESWSKTSVAGVLVAATQVSPMIFELMNAAKAQSNKVRWVIFVRHSNIDLAPYNTKECLFLQGARETGWGPRTLRFVQEGREDHRRSDRKKFRGGVRAKESEFAKERKTDSKVYGRLVDVSAHGAGIEFENDIPFGVGEFIEVAFRDPEGKAKVFHGKICWKQKETDGPCEVGLKFLAAA